MDKTSFGQKNSESELLVNLSSATTICSFKFAARVFLKKFPQSADIVEQYAIRKFSRSGSAGKDLIALVREVKLKIARDEIPGNDLERFLRRAFRRNGGTTEAPKEFLSSSRRENVYRT